MDPRNPHPWDDPAQAPRNFDRALEHPALGVNPADSQDFYDYQNRLALQNQMMHDQMRASSGGTAGAVSDWPSNSSSPKRPRTSIADQLTALLGNLTGEGRPKLSVESVLNAYLGFLDKHKYRLEEGDFDSLGSFLRQAAQLDPSVRVKIESYADLFREHVTSSSDRLRQAEGATAAAVQRKRSLESGDPAVPRPIPHGPLVSWFPSIRKADEAALRGYETQVKNAQFHASATSPLEISNLEGKESQARSDNAYEIERLSRLERTLRIAFNS